MSPHPNSYTPNMCGRVLSNQLNQRGVLPAGIFSTPPVLVWLTEPQEFNTLCNCILTINPVIVTNEYLLGLCLIVSIALF